MSIQIQSTDIPDVLIIHLDTFSDRRGYFLELFQHQRYKELGLPASFVQDNLAGSCQGTLRGLHYQVKQPQGKLVQVISGEVFDVAVDLRQRSTTFGKWVSVCLNAKDKQQLWIPPGFAHGYYVMSEWSEVIYKTTDYYAPAGERTLLWSDDEIAVDWPLLQDGHPIVSEKDAAGLSFAACEKYPDDFRLYTNDFSQEVD
jgi:dTDP-4-dehydrorhamnose 3,5-epimerase